MNVYKWALTIALFAVCGPAFADNSGTLKRKGKTVPVTAIYVEPRQSEQGNNLIVFSDNAKATKAVENQAKTQHSSTMASFAPITSSAIYPDSARILWS
jgi:hypothetical protein